MSKRYAARQPTWSALCCLMVAHWMAQTAAGDLILAYDSQNTAGGLAASETVSGLTPLDLSRGPGIDQGPGSSTYNSDQFTINGTLSDAITNGDYLEWGWSSSATPFNLTDLDIRYDRSPTGPDEIEIRLATNGSALQSIFSDSSVNVNGETNLDIDLSSFTDVTSATFRLIAFGATSGSGTFDIEDFSSSPDRGIAVNAVVVPEPSTVTMMIVAAGVAFASRRRTRLARLARNGS